jgi:hypothetical protein
MNVEATAEAPRLRLKTATEVKHDVELKSKRLTNS